MNEIGVFIQQKRLARNLSLRALARECGVSHVTLSAWEKGTHQPRLSELEAVFDTLRVSEAQRRQALALMDAPRAVIRLRREIVENTPELTDLAAAMPGTGDLLRGMRLRRGICREEVAQALGLSVSTLSRWERSEMRPSVENLHQLCFLLHAQEDEIVALTCGLPSVHEKEDRPSPEAVEREFTRLWDANPQAEALRRVSFLSLISRLWRLALRDETYRKMLAYCCDWQSHNLHAAGSYAESREWAQKTLELEGWLSSEHYCRASILHIHTTHVLSAQPNPRRAIQLFESWLDVTDDVAFQGWMMSEIADCLQMLGRGEEALALGEKACHNIEKCDDVREVHIRNYALARLYLKNGRAQEALDRTMQQPLPGFYPALEARDALLEAEILLRLDRHSEAYARLETAYQIIETRGNSTLRFHADALADQFQWDTPVPDAPYARDLPVITQEPESHSRI